MLISADADGRTSPCGDEAYLLEALQLAARDAGHVAAYLEDPSNFPSRNALKREADKLLEQIGSALRGIAPAMIDARCFVSEPAARERFARAHDDACTAAGPRGYAVALLPILAALTPDFVRAASRARRQPFGHRLADASQQLSKAGTLALSVSRRPMSRA